MECLQIFTSKMKIELLFSKQCAILNWKLKIFPRSVINQFYSQCKFSTVVTVWLQKINIEFRSYLLSFYMNTTNLRIQRPVCRLADAIVDNLNRCES